MKNKKKVLAILQSTELYGKERSNIEVYSLLNNNEKIELRIAINKKAKQNLFKYIKDFKYFKFTFPSREITKLRYIKYTYSFIVSNLSMMYSLFKWKPDYVFLNSDITYYDFLLPILTSRAKLIYRIGDEPAYPLLSNHTYNSWVWREIVVKKTHSFISISKYIKYKVEEHGRIDEKDVIIYNFPPTRQHQEQREKSLYLESNLIKFGFIGQIIEEKGVGLLLDAAIEILEERNDVLFYIAGNLEKDLTFSNKLKEKWNKFQMKNHIIFLNEIDDIQLFFQNIDVLCAPSIKQEPLGNIIVEAKKYKTPTIIFNSGGMPELIDHKKNGFICSGYDKEFLSEGITYYLNNSDIIASHGKHAYDSIQELEIDYSSFENKWNRIFELC